MTNTYNKIYELIFDYLCTYFDPETTPIFKIGNFYYPELSGYKVALNLSYADLSKIIKYPEVFALASNFKGGVIRNYWRIFVLEIPNQDADDERLIKQLRLWKQFRDFLSAIIEILEFELTPNKVNQRKLTAMKIMLEATKHPQELIRVVKEYRGTRYTGIYEELLL